MASIKQLAGQTVWYGLSNIASKFLNYLLTPLITYLLQDPRGLVSYGESTVLYASISFANVIFTYGMETAYFRFSNTRQVDKDHLFQTSFGSLLITTLLLSIGLIAYRHPIAEFLDLEKFPIYISWCVWIIAFDTLAALPFARLRQENRPKRYAFTKVAGILVNIVLTVWLIGYSPKYVAAHPHEWYAVWYRQYSNTGFLMLANLAASATTFFLLSREWKSFRFKIDVPMWREVLAYALPFVIIGLGGMVNETMDRILLQKLLPGTEAAAKQQVGIYSANYKLAIFITLFIQAFRMAAEPFFFRQSEDKNAPKTYARVMKWFVITLCFAFLFTALFLDVWQYMVGPAYRSGLGVVPILLFANIALGIYYNLSVWYKISGRLKYGTGITLIGAAITLALNWILIPYLGIYASALATLACYVSMMLLSYFYGQKYYPIPYATTKIVTYLAVITALFLVQRGIYFITDSFVIHLASGIVLMLLFIRLLMTTERNELRSFPVVGKWIK